MVAIPIHLVVSADPAGALVCGGLLVFPPAPPIGAGVFVGYVAPATGDLSSPLPWRIGEAEARELRRRIVALVLLSAVMEEDDDEDPEGCYGF